MKLLNAKNKKTLILTGAIFAAVILAAVLVRAYKAGAKTATDYWGALVANVKAMISFDVPKMIVFVAASILANEVCSAIMPASDGLIVFAIALGTLTTAAGVVSTFNSTYVPEFFFYTAATQLTGVKITIQGDGVVFDSDAAGLNHVGVSRLVGQVTNSFYIRLTNGFIKAKNVIWEFTNSAAQTPVIYVDSQQRPGGRPKYLQFLRQAILANSGQDFSDFATLSLPSIAATDVVNILYRDGTQQQLTRQDILAKLQYMQNVVNTPVYCIDNYAQTIKKVNIIAGAAQTAYVQRWVAPASDGMISQQVN
jgi:hypothetical protein